MSLRALVPAALSAAILAAVPHADAADAGAARLVPAADGGAPPPPVPACIAVNAEARYVPFGYNHVVGLKNGCSQDAVCTVFTDVNPQPTTTEVKAGTTVEVVTFMGSPSQVFTPKVSCKLR